LSLHGALPVNIFGAWKFHKYSCRIPQTLDIGLGHTKFVDTFAQYLKSRSDRFVYFAFYNWFYLGIGHAHIYFILQIFVEENIWGSEIVFAREFIKSPKE